MSKKYFYGCLETLYFGSEINGLFSRLGFLLFENRFAEKYGNIKISLNCCTIKSRNCFTHSGHRITSEHLYFLSMWEFTDLGGQLHNLLSQRLDFSVDLLFITFDERFDNDDQISVVLLKDFRVWHRELVVNLLFLIFTMCIKHYGLVSYVLYCTKVHVMAYYIFIG